MTRQSIDENEKGYAWLKRRLLALLLCGVVAPLLALGWGLHLYHARAAHEGLLASFEEQLGHHRKVIELFLADREARLQLLASTDDLETICAPGRIADHLSALNRGGWSYADLGVIDERGRHLAYAGPFDLLERNYADADWFAEVMARDVHVTDMFRGFRDEPHFVIAMTKHEADRSWILRATIDTEYFRSLVEDVRMGRTGEVFLVDRDGNYQTRPRFGGEIMEDAGLPSETAGPGVARVRVEAAHRNDRGERIPRRVIGTVRLEEPSWRLVIRQDYNEAFGEVVRVNRASLVCIHLAVLLFGAAGLFVVRRLLAMLRLRDREGAELHRQLLQAGKMAALGELAAGVAHEINNPLAIIATERQLLLDALDGGEAPAFAERLRASLDQTSTQVERCRRITHALLDFARPARASAEELDVNDFLRTTVALVEREAAATGIEFTMDLQPALSSVRVDPDLMQQVLLNLINNAIDAHEGKPYGTVTLRTRERPDLGCVETVVTDTGCGVAPEDVPRIFDPFFTTKATGKGTGLGLSICLGIVRGLGGDISVESEVGNGTRLSLLLPVHAAVSTEMEVTS